MSGVQNVYIAVIDDEESVCRSLSRLLRASRFVPIAYLTAEEFLADSRRPEFACLVLDVQLGGMSGPELMRRLAAVGDRTPVVFITAHDEPHVRAEAEALGCAAFYSKTAAGADVVAAIRCAVGVPEDKAEPREAGRPTFP